MLFIYYPKCSTCQKAKKWLDAQEISYIERHIVEENPTYEELKKWQARSGLPIKKFFNTSGMLYKEMQLKDKLPQMSEDEQLKLLATNGMLVKRPVIVDGDTVLTGFRERNGKKSCGDGLGAEVSFLTRKRTRGFADWRRRKDDASVCAVGVLHGEGMAGADGDDDAYSEAGKCAVDCGK